MSHLVDMRGSDFLWPVLLKNLPEGSSMTCRYIHMNPDGEVRPSAEIKFGRTRTKWPDPWCCFATMREIPIESKNVVQFHTTGESPTDWHGKWELHESHFHLQAVFRYCAANPYLHIFQLNQVPDVHGGDPQFVWIGTKTESSFFSRISQEYQPTALHTIWVYPVSVQMEDDL